MKKERLVIGERQCRAYRMNRSIVRSILPLGAIAFYYWQLDSSSRSVLGLLFAFAMFLMLLHIGILCRELGCSRNIEVDPNSETIRLLVGADVVGQIPTGAMAIQIELHTVRTARHAETLFQCWVEASGCRFCFVRAAFEGDKNRVLSVLRHALPHVNLKDV